MKGIRSGDTALRMDDFLSILVMRTIAPKATVAILQHIDAASQTKPDCDCIYN